MATTKNSSNRSRTSNAPKTNGKARSTASPDDNVVLRAARTVRDRPYASAAIATGAVTAVAAAAAGAFFFSRRDKSFKDASSELSARVKEGFTGAGDRISSMFSSEKASRDGRSQSEIAEEALTLKETGAAPSPLDQESATGAKTGAIAY